MPRPYPDDDDDDGPGFLSTALWLSLAAGGSWLVYKYLTTSAAAATAEGLTTPTPGENILSALAPLDLGQLINITPSAQMPATAPDSTTGQGLPLGIANNNPGNIRWSAANNWEGQTGQDANGFATFSDPVYGLRAMFKLLATYQNEIQSGQGTFDILSVSRQWTATDQDAWASNVASASGISTTTPLDSGNAGQMQAIVNGIVVAENGGAYDGYYLAQIPSAYSMA